MRRRYLPLLLLIAAGPADDFRAGQWHAQPIAGIGEARTICLASRDALLTGGRAGACSISRISEDAQQSVVTWRCADGSSGRTQLRRDAAQVYTIHVQGVDGGLPFMEHGEWRHIGRCR